MALDQAHQAFAPAKQIKKGFHVSGLRRSFGSIQRLEEANLKWVTRYDRGELQASSMFLTMFFPGEVTVAHVLFGVPGW